MAARSIIVASDGSAGSQGALELARALQERDGGSVEIVAAVEPMPVFHSGFLAALPEPKLRESQRTEVLNRLRTRLVQVGPPATDWPIHLQSGVASALIAERADAVGADLILAGLAEPRPIHRILGRETVLELLHLSPCPVLSVPGTLRSLPQTALVAVDFSHFGDRAAQAVTALLSEDAQVHLVHVFTGFDEAPSVGKEWQAHFEDEARDRLNRLGRELGFSSENTVVHMREGDPASELLRLVDELGAQLLVAGTHGHSFLGRLLGSVSTRLARHASTAVFLVPPSHEPRWLGEHGGASPNRADVHPWTALLADFTERHAGHRVTLDVDASTWGTRLAGSNVPILDVIYDPSSDCVAVTLGTTDSGSPQMAHWIPEPGRVLVFQDRHGRESGLRIEAPGGTVVLTLSPPDVGFTPPPPTTVS